MSRSTLTQTALPVAVRQDALREQMDEETREAVDQIAKLDNDAMRTYLLAIWDKGSIIRKLSAGGDEEAPSRQIKLIADYFGEPTELLYRWRLYAIAYNRDFIKVTAEKVMADGKTRFSFEHLDLLRSLPKSELKRWYDVLCNQRALSARVLAGELDAKRSSDPRYANVGRKPSISSNPIVVLDKFTKFAQSFINYEELFEKKGKDIMDSSAGDEALMLKKLKQTEETLGDLAASVHAAREDLQLRLSVLGKAKQAEKAQTKTEAASIPHTNGKAAKGKNGHHRTASKKRAAKA